MQVREVLGGAESARLDMVLLNAGAALMIAEKTDDIAGGVEMARRIIGSGAALEKLDNLVAFCHQ